MQDDRDAEMVEWQRPVDLPGVEILLAERSRRLWRIYHETYTICTLRDCDQSVWGYRGKVHSASTGDAMLMEPGEVHVTMKLLPGPVSFRVALLTPALIDAAANELNVKSKQPHLKAARITHAALFRAFARFHASLEQESSVLERQSRRVRGHAQRLRNRLDRAIPRTRILHRPSPIARPAAPKNSPVRPRPVLGPGR